MNKYDMCPNSDVIHKPDGTHPDYSVCNNYCSSECPLTFPGASCSKTRDDILYIQSFIGKR